MTSLPAKQNRQGVRGPKMTLDSIKQSIKQTPFYECEDGLLYCADCMDILPQLPDGCVDLVLTDPPYGIGESKKNNASRGIYGGLNNSALYYSTDYPIEEWDSSPMTAEQYRQMARVGRNQIIFGANHFSDLLPPSSCWIVWDKDNGENDFADCELAYTSYSKAVRRIKWKWHGLLQEDMSSKEKRYHRTQKPVGMIIGIFRKLNLIEQIILDPFLGSGTTAVAAKRLGRKFIGIEISEEYCRIAKDRIQAEEKGITVAELKRGQKVLF